MPTHANTASAAVCGADEEAAYFVAQRSASGTVYVTETQHLTPLAAFGGMKQSEMGVEGGTEGLLEYESGHSIASRRRKKGTGATRTRITAGAASMGDKLPLVTSGSPQPEPAP